MRYRIQYASVDGSGYYPEAYTEKSKAIKAAEQHQQKSNANGNPWGYRYMVCDERGAVVHRTRPK